MTILFLSPIHPFLTPALTGGSDKPEKSASLPRWQMQASWVRALERQKYIVRVIKYTPDDKIRLGWWKRIKWNLKVARLVNKKLQEEKIDLIIYSLGADVLLPQTIRYIKTKLGVPLVLLTGVSPITNGNRRERMIGPMVSLVATNDEKQSEEWKILGAKNAVCLPISAIDSELHFDKGIDRDIDVLFVGTLTLERKRFLANLKKLLPRAIKTVVTEFVWEEEYADLINRAKIGINLLRPEMKNGVNLRTFEIPALGAMEITSFCREEWLTPGKEVEVFGSAKEAAKLVQQYLKNRQAREKMAEEGRKRVEKEHTFDQRAEKLMRMIKNI